MYFLKIRAISYQTTINTALPLFIHVFVHEKYIPEKAKNYTSCCKSNQRYAVSKGINCLHPYVEVDLHRNIYMQKVLTDMQN